MHTQTNTFKNLRTTLWIGLLGTLGLVGLVMLYVTVIYPFFLQIIDQACPFYLTFKPADLDLDGDLDILVHNMRKPEEFEAYAGGAIWINQGGMQGGQIGQLESHLSDIEGGWASNLADLDGDGDPDLLVYDGIERKLRLGLNQGKIQGGLAGAFKQVAMIPIPDTEVNEYGTLVVGDIDADGRIDALLLGRGQASAPEGRPYPRNVSWIWFNKLTPDDAFDSDTILITALDGQSVAGAALGDLDGDGDLDLFAVASPTEAKSMNGSTSLLLLNDGAGHFDDSGQRFPVEDSTSLALGDLDGDGDLDALVGYRGGVRVLINQRTGIFTVSDHMLAGGQTRNVLLADWDGDGDLDAAVVGSQQAELWQNDGQGRFIRFVQSIPCSDRQNLSIGDFNGDGHPDIFVAEYNQSAQVWFNDGKGYFSP